MAASSSNPAFSKDAEKFEADKVHDCHFLYTKAGLQEISESDTNIVYESYQSYERKKVFSPSGQADIRRSETDERVSHRQLRERAELENDWMRAEKEYERAELDNINCPLDNLKMSRRAEAKFLLLGMGSPYDKDTGKKAVYQYYLAKKIIWRVLTKLYSASDPEPHKRWKPEVFCDASSWNESLDSKFLGPKFIYQDLEFNYGTLGNALQTIGRYEIFVIAFDADNPIRQMVTDITLRCTIWPEAILCLRHDIDPPPGEDGAFIPGESSERVQKLLGKSYQRWDFRDHIEKELAPGLKSCLYLHRGILW
jgi:hypothetical protein